MNSKGIAGAVITVLIGGTAYTINQTDVINNFAKDTGLSSQQAEEYVTQINEDELVPYSEIGSGFIDDGKSILTTAEQIDCINYQYDWESAALPCEEGKSQLYEIGNDEISLGNAYLKVGSDSASKIDISSTISLIDEVNADYNLEIVKAFLDFSTLDELKKTNSYNKATFQAVLKNN